MITKVIIVSSLLISIVISGFLISHFLFDDYGHSKIKSIPISEDVTCINEDGQRVDWYLVYKLPRAKGASITGSDYIYMDSMNTTWRLGKNKVESQKSIFGRTLRPIYDSYKENNSHVGYILFNDGVPEVRNYSILFGHTKGVISWTLYGGFYLTHSVPKFPPFPMRGYSYPITGTKYGQTALCISLPYEDILELDSIIPINNPRAYNCSIPSVDITNMNNFKIICVEKIINIGTNTTTWITSKGGEEFLLFAKSGNYKKDIMSAWMSDVLKSDLLAETWLHGDKLPTVCRSQVNIYNIAAVSIYTFDFINYNDHSKWAVSLNEAEGWVCIGDINRAPTQRRRGGGYTCSKNIDMYNALRDAVTVFEGCEIGSCSSFVEDGLINSTCPVAINGEFMEFC